MPNILKIRDLTNNSFLAFDLCDLVNLVLSEGERLNWYAFPMGEYMEFVGEAGWPIADRVNASRVAVPLSWQDLLDLAAAIDQTVWGTFLGCKKTVHLENGKALFLDGWHYLDRATPTFYAEIELAFQAVDSSYWLVYAKDETLRERITKAFRDVTIMQVD